tara:strand:+ start:3672 stop:3944 length:273 start_codon:yes stop_codon:yes gene_type:complete
MATPDFYKPGRKATAALERLMKFWEVERKDCTPIEKSGFTMLVRRGLVKNKRGTYMRPDFDTTEELDDWFDWIEQSLGIAREGQYGVQQG